MKAKTMCKRTRAMKKKKVSFKPSTAGFAVGSGSGCDFCVEDANLSGVHALVGIHADTGEVYLKSTGRTYFLIGT
jgi:hypothetical protein